jgi:hypothetical protein
MAKRVKLFANGPMKTPSLCLVVKVELLSQISAAERDTTSRNPRSGTKKYVIDAHRVLSGKALATEKHHSKYKPVGK